MIRYPVSEIPGSLRTVLSSSQSSEILAPAGTVPWNGLFVPNPADLGPLYERSFESK